ncbi:helix-turn-helix domain-containing protein [Methanobacterium sp.]|jgi:AcrR family transcriptional regulator|uniref:TetR/AcrR family transcriptional regulator n=1 Tax=Methanobacterium sp. TaxID=2164 RepID=UPI0031583ABB
MVVEDKKKKILEAALKLFNEKGIDNTSTSLISKEAGVATGTPYLYFENKVDLITELGTSIQEESLGSFLDLIESLVSYKSLKKFWLERVEWGVNNPNKHKFMIQFKSSPYNNKKNTKLKIPDHEKKLLNLIEDGIKNKTLKDLPPKYISKFFSAHVTFTVEYIIQTKTKERKIFFETFFDGIKY